MNSKRKSGKKNREDLDTLIMQSSLVPRPFLYGRDKKGEGRTGLVNNLDPNGRSTGISLTDSCEAMNTYKYIVPH